MKKIISSFLVFTVLFTTAFPCFAEIERVSSAVLEEGSLRIADVRLDDSEEVFKKDLEVINNDSRDIKNKCAGIDKDIRNFLISIGAFFLIVGGWIVYAAL